MFGASGKGGSTTTEPTMGAFPSAPAGNLPSDVSFSAFLNSPVGQRWFGGDQTQEIAPGSATPSSFFQTLKDNGDYWRQREANMTPAERSRRQLLQNLGNSDPQPPAIQPASFPRSQPGSPLVALLAAMRQSANMRT